MSVERNVLYLGGAAAGRFESAPFGVLPVGSVEYHGPAAPFGTDTTLAAGLSRRLAESRDCLVFPPIAYSFVPRLVYRATHGLGRTASRFIELLV